jgi:hypothetical protein
MKHESLASKYNRLSVDRSNWLNRAHRSALLTIPSVQPREGQDMNHMPQSVQSVGARGVNNLASKLSQTLFPTSLPFMRLTVSPTDMDALEAADAAAGGDRSVIQEVEAGLQKIEQQAQSVIQTDGWRPVLAESLRMLVVTGNALIYDRPGGRSPILADLRRYVVDRDAEQRLNCVVLKQSISRVDAEAALGFELTTEQLQTSNGSSTAKSLDLYTGATRREDGKFDFWQEIAGLEVEESFQTFKEQDLPLLPLVFSPVWGESYGRGYVEDYEGDLIVLSKVTQALMESSLVMSKVIFLARPGSATKPNVIDRAPNGSIRVGNAEDIGAVQANKGQDLMMSYQLKNDLVQALSKAFLLNSSVQRSAERVTADEIRYVSQELEDALGGVYASLADTVQRPLVEYLFSKMKRTGMVRGIPDSVKPLVATGLEAISRNHKSMRIQQFLGSLQTFIPPAILENYLKVDNIAADLATSLNLQDDQYIRSTEEIQQLQMEQQQQQAVETLGPEAMRQMGNQQPPTPEA